MAASNPLIVLGALLACFVPASIAQEPSAEAPQQQVPAPDQDEPIQIPREVQELGRHERERATLSEALEKAAKIEAILTQPLTVNGQKLDTLEVQRQTLYLVGQLQMRQKLIEMLIDDQIAEQTRDGKRKVEEFAVLENEVREAIAKNIKSFQQENPGKDFWEALRAMNTTREEYFTMQRSTLLFDRIFFPGIPKNWPDITRECIIAAGGEQGVQFFERFEESVKEGQPVPPLWLHICRQWVMAKLQEWSDVRYASDGLPADVCLEVNGRQWKTEDAMQALGLKITPTDRRRALTEITLQTAMRQELESSGHWLSDEAFKREFAEYREPYDKTPFTLKVMAMNFKGFPSFEIYKQRWRLERSFEKKIANDINDENLAKHLERAKPFLADGRVSVKLIRIPAFDDATGTWREGGWEAARAKAEGCFEQVASGKLDFDAAMREYSSWPEHMSNQGQLPGKSLNEIRQELRESEYTDFIAGYSVGEILFYDVEQGEAAGPLRGQDGYYIGLVTSKQPPAGSLLLSDENQRDLVKQDYLTHRFLDWSNEVAAETSVR